MPRSYSQHCSDSVNQNYDNHSLSTYCTAGEEHRNNGSFKNNNYPKFTDFQVINSIQKNNESKRSNDSHRVNDPQRFTAQATLRLSTQDSPRVVGEDSQTNNATKSCRLFQRYTSVSHTTLPGLTPSTVRRPSTTTDLYYNGFNNSFSSAGSSSSLSPNNQAATASSYQKDNTNSNWETKEQHHAFLMVGLITSLSTINYQLISRKVYQNQNQNYAQRFCTKAVHILKFIILLLSLHR